MFDSIQNLVIFKLGWIACILFAAAGNPILATVACGVVVLVHLARSPVPVNEALLLLVAGIIGLAWESFMVASGLIRYPGFSTASVIAPYWIVAMWVLFATTINHGFSWIKRHWGLALMAGAFGGPMAFFGGSAMGAAQFDNPPLSLAVIGLGWAFLLPLLAFISEVINDRVVLPAASEMGTEEQSNGQLATDGGSRNHV